MENLIQHLFKGLLLAFIYLEMTKTNDMSISNVSLFTLFYLFMIYGAQLTNIDTNVITSAFLTKTVFSLIDERIKKKK